MKSYLAILFILLTGLCSAQQQAVNKFDAQGKRHGLWKGTYDDSGNLRYEGTFEHGRETGVFKFYENVKSAPVAATRDFSAGNGESYTVFFDEKSKKLSEGKEVNRLREGEWKFYYPGKNTIMSVELYSKGKLTGVRKVFFPSGSLAEEAQYKNGLRNGYYKKYTEKGILLEESVYKNREMHGPASFYNGSGELESKGQYSNNIKTGVWKFYERGKLVKEEDVTNKKIELVRQRE